MTNRTVVLTLIACFSIGWLTGLARFQTRTFASGSRRSEETSDAQRRRESEKRMRQRDLERRRRLQERRKEIASRKKEVEPMRKQRRIQLEERRKQIEKEREEAGGIGPWVAKVALGETEEKWKLIQPGLDKVQMLRNQARSTIGAGVSSGSTDSRTGPGVPRLKWEKPWEDKPLNELTEAQRLARHLRMLLERQDTTPQVFSRKMAELRKARSKEAEVEKQLDEARRELREILTTRQEAVLVLLQWL